MKSSLVMVFALAACARGSAVGEIDLFVKDASLALDVAAGDSLYFRIDCDVDMMKLESTPGVKRGSAAKDALGRSQVTVTMKDAVGETSDRCVVKGNGTVQGMSGSRLYEQGLILACTVPAARTGKVTVSATVAWDPGIKPLSGKLEVRLKKK